MKKKYANSQIGRPLLILVLGLSLVLPGGLITSQAQHTQNNYETEPQTDAIDTLTYTFEFARPTLDIVTINQQEFSQLTIPGCLSVGSTPGAPTLPVHGIQLVLPPKTTVQQIEVFGESTPLNSLTKIIRSKPLIPYQTMVPIGFNMQTEFVMNTTLYSSLEAYPQRLSTDYTIGYCRGYTLLAMTVTPLTYIPKTGEVSYYPELTVDIHLIQTQTVNSLLRSSNDDLRWVQRLVSNPDIAEVYPPYYQPLGYPGGLCDPADSYDYVIITTAYNGLDYWNTNTTTPYNWDDLMQRHTADGLNCTLVTMGDINACTDYYNSDQMFNDTPAHIREFCRDAYQDWGTQYVLVGGDYEWIPDRLMKYANESNVDSDLYWSNLDNTFNADHDNRWGEEGDTGFDLYSELFIGRLPCDEPQDVSNWMTKSFYYADSTDSDYLENAAFYGGDTGVPCEGDDCIDYSAIKGTDNWLGPNPDCNGPFPSWLGFQYGFENWNAVYPYVQYNLSVKWTAEPPNPGWQGGLMSIAMAGLKNAINTDQVTLLSGVAHADATMSLDVTMDSWESDYHNTKPFFLHDYGCHSGDMDAADDGVLGSMLFHSDTELAFGVVYNTCYGWGGVFTTNASSPVQAKEFWSYFFDLKNKSRSPGNWQLGKAQAFSKDRMAPTLNWDPSGGSWRAIIQGCLLFADPAQQLKPSHAVLAIDTISGGLFKADAVIHNIGDIDLDGINWSITLNGGIILLGKNTMGSITSIPGGDGRATISSKVILGLGNTRITVTAEKTGWPSVFTKEQDAFVFLSYIFIKPNLSFFLA